MPRWQPGHSGNPAGRKPKPYSITSMIQEAMETEIIMLDGSRTTGEAWVAYQMLSVVLTGTLPFLTGRVDDVPARDVILMQQYIQNRLEGTPKQSVDITTQDHDSSKTWEDALKRLSTEELKMLEAIISKTEVE